STPVATVCASGAATVMERNFITSKGISPLPMRFWRKNTGPGDSSLISSAISAIRGLNTTSSTPATHISNRRRAVLSGSALTAVSVNDLSQCASYPVGVCVGHQREQRQRHQALELTLRDRVITRLEAHVLAVVGMQVNRQEVHRRADAALLQLVDNGVAGD